MAASDFIYFLPSDITEEPASLMDWLDQGALPSGIQEAGTQGTHLDSDGQAVESSAGTYLDSDAQDVGSSTGTHLNSEGEAVGSSTETSSSIAEPSDSEATPTKPANITSFAVITAMGRDKFEAHRKSKRGPRPCHAHRHVSVRPSPEDIKNVRRVEAMCRRVGLEPPMYRKIVHSHGKCYRARFKENVTGYPRLMGNIGRSGFFPSSRVAKKVCVEKLLALIQDILADFGLQVSYEEHYDLSRHQVELLDAMYRKDEPISILKCA